MLQRERLRSAFCLRIARQRSRQRPPTLLPSAPSPGQRLCRDPPAGLPLGPRRGWRWPGRAAKHFPGLLPGYLPPPEPSPTRCGVSTKAGVARIPGHCLNPCLLSRSPALLRNPLLLHLQPSKSFPGSSQASPPGPRPQSPFLRRLVSQGHVSHLGKAPSPGGEPSA